MEMNKYEQVPFCKIKKKHWKLREKKIRIQQVYSLKYMNMVASLLLDRDGIPKLIPQSLQSICICQVMYSNSTNH